MKNEVKIYNHAYSENENKLIGEYIENASEKDLVALIEELKKMYEKEVPDVSTSLYQLQKELKCRDILSQQNKALSNCKKEWDKYYTSLSNYTLAKNIRRKYLEFKQKYNYRNSIDKFCEQENDFLRNQYVSDTFFARAILSDNAKWQPKKPDEPKMIYSSLDEITVYPLSDVECLEKLGKENLEYLIELMLFHIDSPSAASIPVAISFITRKYATRNATHKSKENLPLFTSNLHSSAELLVKNRELLDAIAQLKLDCERLIEEI